MAGQSSHERMLRVLDLIEESATPLTSDDMADRLGFTRSTLYRHLKNLSDAGLVTSFPDVGYALGPRIAELDYKMRNSDPLIIASRPVMAELVEARAGIALLCRRYRDQVLCVHQESRNASFASTYERGRALPLSKGAASRIILAHLPARSIQRLYQTDRRAFAEGGMGKSLDAVKANLKAMRQRGWDITESQVTRGVTGLAAPIFDDRGTVLGSLSLTVGRTRLAEGEIQAIAERVTFCARIVTKALSAQISSIIP
jgi:DNA-binding IclR family transcriptional regulator